MAALDRLDAYERFLTAHPTSSYAARVRGRIESLRFEEAKKAKDPEKLEAYLKANPTSAYRIEAETEIRKLRYQEPKSGEGAAGISQAASGTGESASN